MGQLRTQAVREALRSPELLQEVYEGYRAFKTPKLKRKYPEADRDEIVDLCEKNLSLVKIQLKVAHAITQSRLPANERTAQAAAELSRDVLDVICFGSELRSAQTPLERVACFAGLMDVLAYDPSPVMKNAVFHVLNEYLQSCPKNQLDENLFRPLAVAIGLDFDANCRNNVHRTKIRAFCELYFPEKLKEIKDGVFRMLWFHQRSRTADLLNSWRVLENQSLG
jgi:hypothetical protein